MPRNSLELFSTREDLLSVCLAVEAERKLIYVPTGMFEEAQPVAHSSASELRTLGVSSHGAAAKEPAYLVASAPCEVRPRAVIQREGGVLYAVDQQDNPDSVVLKPGGLYGRDCLIAGQLSTMSASPVSIALFQRFARAIRSDFKKVRSYMVGPEALRLWKAGTRLTIAVSASRQFDLAAN